LLQYGWCTLHKRMSIEVLNLLKSSLEGDEGRKEKNRGDEPIWVIMHIYMEMSQWNTIQSYLKQKGWTGRQNRSYLGCCYQWEGKDIRKVCRRMNMV
jgi:hypothetical protein